jgi:hypothetical protein
MRRDISDEALIVIASSHEDEQIRETAGLQLLERFESDDFVGIAVWFLEDEALPTRIIDKAQTKFKEAVNNTIDKYIKTEKFGNIITDILYDVTLQDSWAEIAKEIVISRWDEFGSNAIKHLVRDCSSLEYSVASRAIRNLLNLVDDGTLPDSIRSEAQSVIIEACTAALENEFELFDEELRRIAKSPLFSEEARALVGAQILWRIQEKLESLIQREAGESHSKQNISYTEKLLTELQEVIDCEDYLQRTRSLAEMYAKNYTYRYFICLAESEDNYEILAEYAGQSTRSDIKKPDFLRQAAKERLRILADKLSEKHFTPEMISKYQNALKGIKPSNNNRKKLLG